MRTVYQTVIDTDDADKIENNGPIKCNANDAWLGFGYYFWEEFISLAHYWGKTHCRGNYVICRAYCDLSSDDIYDLINNPKHIQEFHEIAMELKEKYGNKITVSFILEYLKSINIFAYKAVRACGINSFPNFSNKIPFAKWAHIESLPAWQICFYYKNLIVKGSYKIVYPDEYAQDYVV